MLLQILRQALEVHDVAVAARLIVDDGMEVDEGVVRGGVLIADCWLLVVSRRRWHVRAGGGSRAGLLPMSSM